MQSTLRTARVLIALAILGLFSDASAQDIIRLWPDGPPHTNGVSGPEQGDGCLGNISDPTITVYHPDAGTNNGGAVLVIPGGGYSVVCIGHEGYAVAEWLSGLGYTAAVLKYRLPNRHVPVPFEDAQQGLRMLRARAAEWGIDPQRVGVLGFSAGGHLASTVGTHFSEDFSDGQGRNLDRSNRPDFMILVYPVVTMARDYTHGGSRTNLLGDRPETSMVARFSNQLQVSNDTPPTFLALSSDDGTVPPRNSIHLYESLIEHGIPAEMHVFEKGGHGYGLTPETTARAWPDLAAAWLGRLLWPAE
jgi:acetyl esterase/lipase